MILMPLNPVQKVTPDTFAEKTFGKIKSKIEEKHESKNLKRRPANKRRIIQEQSCSEQYL